MIKTAFKHYKNKKPKVSFVLLDWNCRESLHSLEYLSNQTVPREDYEIIWIEYYTRRFEGLDAKIAGYAEENRWPPVDLWLIMDMPEKLYYHKHLMYNVGIVKSRGDIVVICDSDAMFTPRFVETVLETYAKTPDIVLHFDEVRNSNQEFYPFNFPPFEVLTGDGAINWRDGKTTGLWDTEDPLHSLNYGACMCARRSDLIAIGGADEHMDYLGHVCGPYELTFRLVNAGLKEVWHESEFLYHTWHPGSDGDFNYIGPSDGRHMSTTSLETRTSGRIPPLVENPAVRIERETGKLAGPEVPLIDKAYLSAWTQEEVAKSPRFKLFKRILAGTKLEREMDSYNILSYDGGFYGVPHSLGPRDLAKEEDRGHPEVVRGDSIEAVERLMSAGSTPAAPAAQPAPVTQPAPATVASPPAAVWPTAVKTADPHPAPAVAGPALVDVSGAYSVLAYDNVYYAAPGAMGAVDLTDPTARNHPDILRAPTHDALLKLIRTQRLQRLEAEHRVRDSIQSRLQSDLAAKDRRIAELHGALDALKAEQTARESAHKQALQSLQEQWRAAIAVKDGEIAGLQQALTALRQGQGDSKPPLSQPPTDAASFGMELIERMQADRQVVHSPQGLRINAAAPSGVFLSSPHLRLNDGFYQLEFFCNVFAVNANPNLPLLSIDFARDGEIHLGTVDFQPQKLMSKTAVAFEVKGSPAGGTQDISFRFRHHGRSDLLISTIRFGVAAPSKN